MNTTDMTSPNYAGPCARCGDPVPNRLFQGEYPGALSRYDNETYICSDCGSQEAMMGGHLIPLDVGIYSKKADQYREGYLVAPKTTR